MDPPREYRPVPRIAVVELARNRIAGAAAEIDLRDATHLLLTLPPGDAREVAGDVALPVKRHRMRRIRTDRSDRLLSIPEADGFQPRVDRPHRLRPNALVS